MKQTTNCQLISNLHGTGPRDIFFTYDDQLEEMINQQLDLLNEMEKDANKNETKET